MVWLILVQICYEIAFFVCLQVQHNLTLPHWAVSVYHRLQGILPVVMALQTFTDEMKTIEAGKCHFITYVTPERAVIRGDKLPLAPLENPPFSASKIPRAPLAGPFFGNFNPLFGQAQRRNRAVGM
jgi:hypothetical protein